MNFREEIIERVRLNGGWHNNHAHLDRVHTINAENFSKSQKDLREKWEIVSDIKKNATVQGAARRMMRFT